MFIVINLVICFQLSNVADTIGCDAAIETKEVRGNSLAGLVEAGTKVSIDYAYYQCYEVLRGDLVIYDYAGNEFPLIKIVKGVPGDSISLRRNGQIHHLAINNTRLTNSLGEAYEFNAQQAQMINLYLKSYNGSIPEDAYFLTGNIAKGSVDSSVFGFVSKRDILGKVLWEGSKD